ncbi:hypothetical protein KFK09_015688 [Dendrobium nobile]|uniref:Uncharacterized protein n=1 Tax=Dendrobium nobile TaxID=94219 RepID=A0A8T3B6Y5_DENNO|nr:hypothetical protein KFK09_015688 [Dendrobium nobile]
MISSDAGEIGMDVCNGMESVIAYEEHLATGPPCRSEGIPSSSSLQSKATGSCSPGVCGNTSKQLTSNFP